LGQFSYAAIETSPTYVSAEKIMPMEFSIEQNYPNPFNPSTTITFSLPSGLHVDLRVYNMLGQEIATLVNGIMPAGEHQAVFTADHLGSGVYFYKLTAGKYSIVKRMLMLK
jgi:hypothetical protein